MAGPKKNQLFQIPFPMVDRVDFATIESGVTASMLNATGTRKFFGVNHGGSVAFTSGAISKAIRDIRSGVFQLTLKATENNYDRVIVQITHGSCAVQMLEWDNADNDDSDLMSALTVIQSMASDAASAAAQANSRILVVQSIVSDVRSHVSDLQSDFQSRVPKAVASLSKLSDVESNLLSLLGTTGIQLNASTMSDLRSAISGGPAATVTASDISDIASAVRAILVSDLSDILSAAQQVNSRVLVAQSFLSDIRSHVSDLQSDFQSRVPKRVATDSQLSDMASDLKSAIAAGGGTVTVSNISDIASAVMVAIAATGVPLDASTMSDLRSSIAAGGGTALTLSDIASAIAVELASTLSDTLSAAQQTNSRALVAQSFLSDIRSHVSDLQSDFQSRVPKRVATDSQLSDLASDLKSAIAVGGGTVTVSNISDIVSAMRADLASNLSDILSAAQQVNSRALVAQSFLSDIRSHVSDLQSDFQSRVPKLVATNSQLSDLASDLKSAVAVGGGTVSVSNISDIVSALRADLASDLSDTLSAARQANSRVLALSVPLSDIISAIATVSVTLTASNISDIVSALRAELASDLSDTLSAARQGASRTLVVQSQASDLASKLSDVESNLLSVLGTTGVQLNASSLSDIRSAIGGVTVNLTGSDISDIASAVAAAVTVVTVSNISDIASAVRATLVSDLSDILSAAQQANSRVLVAQSFLSDIRSHVSDLQSDFQSRVPKRVATDSQLSDLASDLKSAIAVGGGTVTISNISDIVSAMRADLASNLSDILSAAQQTNSRANVNNILVDMVLSSLSAQTSDLKSVLGTTGVQLNASSLSDLRSAITAGGGGALTTSNISDIVSAMRVDLASNLSDILSAVQQVNSRALVAQSFLSDIRSQITALPDASDMASAVWAETGVEPTAEPAHTASRGAKVDWMTALSRNKIRQSGTLQELRNLADTANIASATVADSGGSFVRGSWS